VQFTDGDLETPFDSLESFTSSGSGAISTPEVDRRNRYHPAAGHTPRSLPLSPSQPTVPATNVVGMLQEQQGLLQKLLREQQEITKAVKKNDKRIALIEVTLEKYNESSNSCSSSGEKKRSVTKDLTDKVAAIHSALDEGLRPEESSLSPFNAGIKAKIVMEICGDENTKYTQKQVKGLQCTLFRIVKS